MWFSRLSSYHSDTKIIRSVEQEEISLSLSLSLSHTHSLSHSLTHTHTQTQTHRDTHTHTHTHTLTIPGALDVQVSGQAIVREREKFSEASSDVDGVWCKGQASRITLLCSVLARTERRHSELTSSQRRSHVYLWAWLVDVYSIT